MVIFKEDRIALFIDEDHKTTQNLLKTKAFTVSLADKDHMDAADFFGIAFGSDHGYGVVTWSRLEISERLFSYSKSRYVLTISTNAFILREWKLNMKRGKK